MKVPKDLEGLINKTALAEGLEPRLLQSIIKQESGFNPTATSSVGARGLMQLMPATAKELATSAGLDNYDLFDPETNLKLGARYYKQLRDEFNGDDALALTAYHSGIGRVKKLLAKNGGTGLDDIIGDLGTVGQKYAKSILSRV